jgi:hypothetical protein
MIYFHLQGAPDFARLPFLCGMLAKNGCEVGLNLDAKLSLDAERQAILADLPAQIVPGSRPITWGGASQVECLLRGIRHALASSSSWEYLANLSFTDAVIRPIPDLQAFLRASAARNVRNFVFNYGEKAPEFPPQQSGEAASQPVYWRNDVRIFVQPVLKDLFANWEKSPLGIAALRPGLFLDEDGDKAELRFRTLSPGERSDRQAFFRAGGYRHGRQWVMLHRSMCEWLVSSDLAHGIWQVMQHVFVADEAFFQTACFHPACPHRQETANRSLHLADGTAQQIDDSWLERLQHGPGAFFARKVDWARSPNLSNWLRSL